MMIFMIMPLIIWIPLGVYLYHIFMRFLSLFEGRIPKKPRVGLSVLFTVLCVMWGWMLYGLGAVVLLHFIVFTAVMEIVWRILRRKLSDGNIYYLEIIYKSSIVSIALVFVVLGYGMYNMRNVKETTYTVTTKKQIPTDFKIAQISDVHAGTTSVKAFGEYTKKINDQHPDIVALTGDIFDERTSKADMERTIDYLKDIKTTYGIYYVWGNHDYNSYRSDPNYTPDQLRETLSEAGIHVLEDDALQVNNWLVVAGRQDATIQDRKSVGDVISETDSSKFVLLLDHQPRGLKESRKAGVDLQLSGHTHAGQIFPTGQLGVLTGATELNYGLKKDGEYTAIVSSGYAGWGYAIRTGGHSEYSFITVKSQQ